MGLLSPKLSLKHMTAFCRGLALAHGGGIPIPRCMQLLAQKPQIFAVRRLAERLKDCMERGATFAQAVHWERRRLPDFFVALIAVGEKTGTLHHVLPQLAAYYEEQRELRGELIRQITYPACILACIWFGIPVLKIVLVNATVGSKAGLLGPIWDVLRYRLIMLATILALVSVLGHIPPLVRLCQAALLYAWPASRVVRRFARARFGWAMHFFAGTGIAPHLAIPLAAQSAGLWPMARDLNKAVAPLQAGATLTEALAPSRYLSRVNKGHIEVGERSGKLDEAFASMAREEYREAMHVVRMIIRTIGGILIVALGFGII